MLDERPRVDPWGLADVNVMNPLDQAFPATDAYKRRRRKRVIRQTSCFLLSALVTSRSNMKKLYLIALAFLVAPIVPAVAFGAGLARSTSHNIFDFYEFAPVFYVYALIPTIGVALPLYFIAYRLKLIRWWTILLGGTLTGAVVACLQLNLTSFLSMSCLGLLSAMVFWSIWRKSEE